MKRYKEKGGKIYARITYTDAAGKQREIWRRAESRTEAKDIARELEHQLKTQDNPVVHPPTNTNSSRTGVSSFAASRSN